MNGFNKIVKANRIKKGVKMLPISGMIICNPSDTKKITAKKSFKGLTELTMFKLYGMFAIVIPANKAPIATERPNKCAIITNIKHTPSESKKSNSCDFAANLKMGNIKNLFSK